MNTRATAALVVCTALAAACTSDAHQAASPAADTAAPVPQVRDLGGAWTADPRWTARVGELEAASADAAGRLGPDTGLTFETGHEPVVVFDESAPVEGDVAPRFDDGVRRPVIRIRPHALLSGEFAPQVDLGPLVMEGAIAMAAGDREPPAWVLRGVAIVAADAFDPTLHRRALGGDEVRTREDELFGATASDRLAAAARAKALARVARSERPFARFLQALNAGRPEAAALAEIGIGPAAFLDAAADTERARAAHALADDPMLPLLRGARTALAAGDVGRADAALAPFAGVFDDPALDAWIVADARLCLAEIEVVRGEKAKAKEALDAAVASSRIVRVRQARVLGVCVASEEDRPALLHDLLVDWPDAATTGRSAELLKTR